MNKPSRKELLATIVALSRAGQMCSNICYNLAKNDCIPTDYARSMTQSYRAWDEASRAANNLLQPNKKS